jgi:hypothetical protein
MAGNIAGKFNLDDRLLFRKDWVFDPVPWIVDKFKMPDLARLAVVQLRAQHAILKAQEEAIEEAIEIYSGYIK